MIESESDSVINSEIDVFEYQLIVEYHNSARLVYCYCLLCYCLLCYCLVCYCLLHCCLVCYCFLCYCLLRTIM